MNILFIGDVFGTVGRHVLVHRLPSLLEENKIDLCIANGENAAGGTGITGNIFKKLRKYGVHAVTGGNHSFTYAESEAKEFAYPELLRPANFPPGNIGHGSTLFKDRKSVV
jgi:2',3'-cyclic-nucleotide 2'-phosphodiesterase